jgi:hypothetical protein
MECIKNEIVQYNSLIHKGLQKEEFEKVKMRIWDLLCASSDVEIIHQTNKTKKQITNIIKD